MEMRIYNMELLLQFAGFHFLKKSLVGVENYNHIIVRKLTKPMESKMKSLILIVVTLSLTFMASAQ